MLERPFTSGFPISEFARRGIGSAARCDHVDYRRELRHLEEVAVEPWLAGLSEDGSRFRFRNVLRKAGGEEAAPVTTEAGWLDLTERRLTLTGGRSRCHPCRRAGLDSEARPYRPWDLLTLGEA